MSLSPSVSVSRELFPCGLEPPDTETSEEEPPAGDTAEYIVHPVTFLGATQGAGCPHGPP